VSTLRSIELFNPKDRPLGATSRSIHVLPIEMVRALSQSKVSKVAAIQRGHSRDLVPHTNVQHQRARERHCRKPCERRFALRWMRLSTSLR
jgi:hypothetical protein